MIIGGGDINSDVAWLVVVQHTVITIIINH